MLRPLNDIHQRASEHMKMGTTDIGERVTANPVSSYSDPVLFEKEMHQIFRSRPIPIVSPSKIPKPGDYFAQEICGVPVLVIRGEDGTVRAFLNVCRHRGAKLISNGEGHDLKDIACPFHGWSYRSNGPLFHIPEIKKCFTSPKMDGYGLVELKSIEAVGMLWVLLDRASDFSLERAFASLAEDFAYLGFSPRFPLDEFVHVGDFNWKIGVEAFLEVDHFPFAHAPYLSNIQFPSLSLVDSVDENYRIVVPLKEPAANEFILKWAQVMYFVFPSTFMLFYSDHIALLSLTPISVDKTEFRYIPLVPHAEDLDNQKIRDKADFLKVIIQQDFDILYGIQKSLRSGANTQFTFTRTEYVLMQFHKRLAELL
jgi:phenylpropionate dioxygenase-like ring-hydroxylating dioxygenase large terminal subunit